jgi:hypothetical protein
MYADSGRIEIGASRVYVRGFLKNSLRWTPVEHDGVKSDFASMQYMNVLKGFGFIAFRPRVEVLLKDGRTIVVRLPVLFPRIKYSEHIELESRLKRFNKEL